MSENPSDTALWVSFVLAMLAMTIVLIWGLKQIHRVLTFPSANGKSTLARQILSEPPPSKGRPTTAEPGQPTTPEEGKGSFSRLAGTIGAMAMASTFVGIGYWVIHGLFFAGDLDRLRELGWYFLPGAAMFMPYAVNKLTEIFKP